MIFRDTINTFRLFGAGFLISSCLAFFLYVGIMLTYHFLPGSILLLFGLALVCSIVFWMNVTYDQMNDVTEVISRTVAFDFTSGQKGLIHSFTHLLIPLNPYIGVVGTVSGLLLFLWAVPAVIMYWLRYPDSPGLLLKACVYCLSAAGGIVYFFLCRDKFPSIPDKVAFFAGVSLGPLGAFKIIT